MGRAAKPALFFGYVDDRCAKDALPLFVFLGDLDIKLFLDERALRTESRLKPICWLKIRDLK